MNHIRSSPTNAEETAWMLSASSRRSQFKWCHGFDSRWISGAILFYTEDFEKLLANYWNNTISNFILYSCRSYIQKLNFLFKNGVTCYSYVLGNPAPLHHLSYKHTSNLWAAHHSDWWRNYEEPWFVFQLVDYWDVEEARFLGWPWWRFLVVTSPWSSDYGCFDATIFRL